MARPALEHGTICMTIGALLFAHVKQHDLGRVASNGSFVKTGPESVRGADVLFYGYERLPRNEAVPRGFHSSAPDLVVEVKSPSDRWGELFARMGEYLQSGVRVVVALDAATSSALVYRQEELPQTLHNGDELTLPEVLPGIRVQVGQLFA